MAARLGMITAQETVLEFLNTIQRQGEKTVDLLGTCDDVIRWLKLTGFAGAPPVSQIDRDELVREARCLREHIRELVCRRRIGAAVDVSLLNKYLSSGTYRIELCEDELGQLHAVRRFSGGTPQQLLMSIALAAADLLAQGDFQVIRKCEGANCNLWFYDRTRSHRRRWCQMSVCGNRHKVAEFRTRGNVK
ncbi:CGNR zinc finger domain-containing protein [Paraburkholderia oxyphila]|uniref:CGNR zinc finger domain-containing protein n=1 Tax=Paraburkholderia oxyphila TaxID=614212 RepID=UPI0005BB9CDF|nr:ABATE domain-containing protein [Paraburkholderia oxyphila]